MRIFGTEVGGEVRLECFRLRRHRETLRRTIHRTIVSAGTEIANLAARIGIPPREYHETSCFHRRYRLRARVSSAACAAQNAVPFRSVSDSVLENHMTQCGS